MECESTDVLLGFSERSRVQWGGRRERGAADRLMLERKSTPNGPWALGMRFSSCRQAVREAPSPSPAASAAACRCFPRKWGWLLPASEWDAQRGPREGLDGVHSILEAEARGIEVTTALDRSHWL